MGYNEQTQKLENYRLQIKQKFSFLADKDKYKDKTLTNLKRTLTLYTNNNDTSQIPDEVT